MRLDASRMAWQIGCGIDGNPSPDAGGIAGRETPRWSYGALASLRDLRYRLEAIAARLGFVFLRALPVDAASALGGWLGRRIGPLLSAHRVAERNLRRALPHLTDAEVSRTLRAMWDNLGRVLAECAKLPALLTDTSRVEMVDDTDLARRLKEDGIGAILISAHFGNWELSALPGYRVGLQQHNFYRAPNNLYMDGLIRQLRSPLAPGGFLRKSAEGGRKAFVLLRQGHHIGMLVDQKQNEGIAVPFFGRDAMTTPTPAIFAHRLGVPIAAARVERLKGARFRIIGYSIELASTGDRDADIRETTRRINALLESWIRERPEQWLWAHRRWPD
jgi:KDO2-lipid IV(A) lauroyltransferase